ncbi:MAG: tyrosine-type recombinase/integrase [Firmicutes bacterium]|nr:tyrosine-type recombinase/integrase [Bacillota bacterium]
MEEEKARCILNDYEAYLTHEEKSSGTKEKYLRDVRSFLKWMENSSRWNQAMRLENVLSMETAAGWKETLQNRGYKAVTINSMLGSLNSFLCFMGKRDCRVKYLRIQTRIFRTESRALCRQEYEALKNEAEKKGRYRLKLLMETICATGIRVSEVRFITVKAAEERKAEITLKGKTRTILIPKPLAKKLLLFSKKENIKSGEIFLSKNKKSLSRKQIWAEMKSLCLEAGVAESKVFPHNLRHLFATTFYGMYQDIVRLADILGHSSMETTRIYLMTPESEHVSQLEKMNLVT